MFIFGYLEEYIELNDNKYIEDIQAEFKTTKDRSKEGTLRCKLTFEKKIFLESYGTITDLVFVQLSYVLLCIQLLYYILAFGVIVNLCLKGCIFFY